MESLVQVVVFLQIILDVILYRIFEGGCIFVVADLSELGYFGFGEILILVAHRIGHINVFDIRLFAHCGENRFCQVVPGSCGAGAEIKQARQSRIVPKELRHVDRVFDVNKVPQLLAVLVLRFV